jgi:protocatechuate 3,4-dioxygenase beta subunit
MAWTMVGDPIVKQAEGTRANPIVMKLLPQTHQVTGSVLDQSGKPVPGVEVTVKSLSQPANRSVFLGAPLITGRFPRAVADPSGRFALTLPEDTDVWLSVRHSRYVGETMVTADAKVLEPMVLEPAGGIAGTLIDDATSRPVAGASVGAQIVEWRRKNLGGWGEVITDAQGKFVIVGLEPGVYDLMLMNVPSRAHATALAVEGVRVRAGVNSAANLTLFEGRPLPGVVIDQENNQPMAGIPVGCYGPARPQAGFRVHAQRELTDEQGRFTFYVPPGEHYVHIMEAVMSGRRGNRIVIVPERGEIEPVRLFRSNPAAANSSTLYVKKVAIEPAEPEKVVVDQEQAKAEQKETREAAVRPRQEAVMKAKENVKPSAPVVRTVTGHVRDQQGRPIPGVTVQVNPEPGTEPFDSAVTDRDGLFVYEGLPRRLLNINLARPDLKTIQTEPLPPDRDTVEWTCRSDVDASKKRLAAPTVDEPIPAELRGRLTFVDLAPRGNDPLADGPGGGGNDLNRLPRGVHKMGDAYFRVGEMMIHVQGQMGPELPRAVKGIKVQAQGNRLHILHATQYVATPGTIIGAYLIHYSDGSNERIPIVYGRNLVNWWVFPSIKEEPTGARIAWTGSSDATDMNPGIKVRVFATTWTNPHPEKEVATLDMLSAGTECDPFLVAVTLERDK